MHLADCCRPGSMNPIRPKPILGHTHVQSLPAHPSSRKGTAQGGIFPTAHDSTRSRSVSSAYKDRTRDAQTERSSSRTMRSRDTHGGMQHASSTPQMPPARAPLHESTQEPFRLKAYEPHQVLPTRSHTRTQASHIVKIRMRSESLFC